MTKKALPSVRLDALRDALLFIDDVYGGAEAWVDLRTGAVHIVAEGLDPDELALPEDLGDPEHFLALPPSRDLYVERELAFDFVARHLPADERLVRAMFTRKGAYRALRELLDERGVLEEWYRFKGTAVDAALAGWCGDNGLRLHR
ncbi:hypothetical protein ACSUZJ_05455 [Telluria sp. B2]